MWRAEQRTRHRASRAKGRRGYPTDIGDKVWKPVEPLLGMNLIADSASAQLVLDAPVKRWPWVKHLFGDAAYDRSTMLDRAAYLDPTVEFVRCLQGQDGFQVQPRRWLVARTYAWLMCYRRLARDYDQRLDVSQAMICITFGSSLTHRMRYR